MLKYGKKKKSQKNRIIAIGTTYFVSSLLHGLEQRLSAVLLSLAAYTYVEYQIRSKLAIRFPKLFFYYKNNYDFKKNISSSNKNTWFLWGINILFTILNLVHLAYLGSIMDMSSKSDNTFQVSFTPWSSVFYFSHFIMLLMYFISIIL